MVKTLVVMRHGKALPPMSGQRDKDRSLTKAGMAALEARLPYMLRLLEAQGAAAQVWSSPAKRARQTAQLLEDALRKRGVPLKGELELHDCLWEQDMDAFLDELRASEAELVFAVGHVPFTEDVVEELAGSTPPFSTGALCCLELRLADARAKRDPKAQDGARLLWFAQGPAAARWDTLVQLQATLTATAEVIEERRRAFFANPADVETIHRFRTNIRTLRSFLSFIKPWQNAAQNAETQEILKGVVRYTSRLRELDVLERQVRAHADSSPELIAFCSSEAMAERSKVLKILANERVAQSFERAMSAAKSVAWKRRYAKRGLARSMVRARFDALIEAVSAELATVDLHDAERTHDVRKRAKRARYVAEFSSGILGADAAETARGMTAHQDALGDVCDARANIRLMDEFLQRDLPESVVRGLVAIRAQNEAFLLAALESR